MDSDHPAIQEFIPELEGGHRDLHAAHQFIVVELLTGMSLLYVMLL